MNRRKTPAEVPDSSTVSTIRAARNVFVCEAKTFWQNRRKEGNVDAVFKEVQSKLELLWQKIKHGSATNQDYMRALLIVKDADLGEYETYQCDKSSAEELLEDEDCPPVRSEEHSPTSISSKLEETLPSSEPESSAVLLHFATTRIRYTKHACGQMCLSNVNPHFNKRENPLKFPILCQFKRQHAKSSDISKPLDVIYKAPCGKSLRNFDDVYSYLFKTKCCFLSLDHFSFDTYLQLDRYFVKKQAVFQEADISKDAELVPVPLCNEIDNARPAPFTYRKSPWPRGYFINNFTDLFVGCCDCTDDCSDVSKCACLRLTAREFGTNLTLLKKDKAPGYKHKRLQTPVPTGLYECNVSCACNRKICRNRVVQHGLQVRLQVFKTREMGWGVRCLDDLDKGTFVCIYAGRILMKTSDVNTSQESVMQTSICPTKKICSSHSDSEITASPSVLSSNQKFRITPLIKGSSQTILKRKNLRHLKEGKQCFKSIKRPKTKTSILQKRRKQLMEEGTVTTQHSSDDDLFTPPASPKLLHPGGCEDETVEMTRTTRSNSYLTDEEAGYVSVESSSSAQCGSKENADTSHTNTEENIYFLDASAEGNVGRFLNHSCSPNLFVQHVFVETHYKKFPWLAFFTKSSIKGRTELTWDYNYDIGSIPEKEIPCLCGHKMCKNIIV